MSQRETNPKESPESLKISAGFVYRCDSFGLTLKSQKVRSILQKLFVNDYLFNVPFILIKKVAK